MGSFWRRLNANLTSKETDERIARRLHLWWWARVFRVVCWFPVILLAAWLAYTHLGGPRAPAFAVDPVSYYNEANGDVSPNASEWYQLAKEAYVPRHPHEIDRTSYSWEPIDPNSLMPIGTWLDANWLCLAAMHEAATIEGCWFKLQFDADGTVETTGPSGEWFRRFAKLNRTHVWRASQLGYDLGLMGVHMAGLDGDRLKGLTTSLKPTANPKLPNPPQTQLQSLLLNPHKAASSLRGISLARGFPT